MSMNFAREQSLLRQKLQAKASPERANARSAPFGGAVTFLGADDADVAAAAEALAAAWPQMGRAQMTAFVRTLWNSKVHELRDVGSRLLAMRGALLEPADVPLLEGFLADAVEPAVATRLAADALGAIAARHRKLWRDLKRCAAASDAGLRRAAVLAAGRPLAADPEAFPRFLDLVEPLLAAADASLLAAVDATLAHAASAHREAVVAFATRLGRRIAVPPAAVVAAAPAAPPKKKPALVVTPPTPQRKVATKPAAKKPPAKARTKPAPSTAPVAGKPAARGKAGAPARKPAAKTR